MHLTSNLQGIRVLIDRSPKTLPHLPNLHTLEIVQDTKLFFFFFLILISSNPHRKTFVPTTSQFNNIWKQNLQSLEPISHQIKFPQK